MNDFSNRTISGVCFVGIMLASLLLNHYLFGAVMLFALVVMMWEFLRMTCGTEYRYSQILSIVAGATMFIMTFFHASGMLDARFLVLSLLPFFILMIDSLYVKDKSRFAKFACLYTAILYIAVPWTMLSYAAFTSGAFSGKLLICFFSIVWGSDVGAYIFGVTLGQKYGKKLFPSVSPKKSWIGFWGGLVTAITVAVIFYFTRLFDYSLIHCIALAVIQNVTGVYGDLIESQWKRHYEVKDSGYIIPGHGGLLDRFDSALLAIPSGVMYLIIMNLV